MHELNQLAKLKKINIPKNWSTTLIVELLALNVSKAELQTLRERTSKTRTESTAVTTIRITNLVKQFGNINAVDGVTLEIREGELFSLLGPNGAGKTTILNILTGILKPTKGTVIIGGYNVSSNLEEIKTKIGVCPQQAAVFNFLSARENIEFFGNLHAIPRKELKERMEHLLEILDLVEVSTRKAKGYSGGMLRKLNLIIALISDPEIAFLDEPTVGMDPRARRATWDFIETLKKRHKTIILTTHYIEEAEALSDRVGILDYGKLIELGTPQELLERYGANNLEEVFLNITGRRIVEGI